MRFRLLLDNDTETVIRLQNSYLNCNYVAVSIRKLFIRSPGTYILMPGSLFAWAPYKQARMIQANNCQVMQMMFVNSLTAKIKEIDF